MAQQSVLLKKQFTISPIKQYYNRTRGQGNPWFTEHSSSGDLLQVCHCILLFLDWYWSALLMNSSLYQFFRSGNVTSFEGNAKTWEFSPYVEVFQLMICVIFVTFCVSFCSNPHPIIFSGTFDYKILVSCVEAMPLIW